MRTNVERPPPYVILCGKTIIIKGGIRPDQLILIVNVCRNMTNEIADTTVQPVDWEARALKAENKIVSMKKATVKEDEPEVKEEPTPIVEETTKADDNTGETLETLKAKIEALEKEADIERNVNETNMMTIDGSETSSDNSSIKLSDLENMSQADYNKAKDLLDRGEATLERDV